MAKQRTRGTRKADRAQAFRIGGWPVEPGTRKTFDMRLGETVTQTPIGIRVVVIHGRRPGPRLWVSAGVHGDELAGILAVTEVVAQMDPETLAGTLVALPVVNELGAIHCTREFPDGRDLNRCFPGSRTGTLASRVARAFLREIVLRCTHGVDLHTAGGHRDNLPQVRANLDDRETRRLAEAFGTPVVLHANLRDGSLRQAASSRGIPTLLFEGGKALRHEPHVIGAACDGVLRVMSALGMISDAPPRTARPAVSWASNWVRTPRSGYLIPEVDLGDRVTARQVVGRVVVRSPDLRPATHLPIRTPRAGLVVGIQRLPLVNVGDPVVHVADVSARRRAERGPKDRGEPVTD